MRRKTAYSLVLLSMLVAVSMVYNPAVAAPNYKLVGVQVGNTADYSTIIGNSTWTAPDTKLHISVFSVSGALVTFNSTYYFTNGTVDNSPDLDKSFQVNVTAPSLSTLFGWISLTAANLTAHDAVFYGSTGTINETTHMIVAGVNRTVNHLSLSGGAWNLYWDKPTGIMVKMNFWLLAWLNYTMTATNMWSAGGGGLGLSTTTLLIIGGVAVVVIIAAALVLMRRRK
jgi:hypothetical protein